MYRWPRLRVGGRGSPLPTVRSIPVLPPRGPTISYWPELGALSPGLNVLRFAILAPHIFIVGVLPGADTLADSSYLPGRTTDAVCAVVIPLPTCLSQRIRLKNNCVSSPNHLVDLALHHFVVEIVDFHMCSLAIADESLTESWRALSSGHPLHLLRDQDL
jgi:hypothetical protein